MKKIFKLLFSRLTLIFFAILLQVGAVAVILTYFRNYYVWVQIASGVLTLIALLGIINRDMSVEGKLPWALLVALFPVFGLILYLSFSRNYAKASERKLFARLPKIKFDNQQIDVNKKVEGQIRYLNQMGGFTFKSTDTTYFASGEEFWQDLLAELDKAEKFIFMEYFIVERGKMFDAILDVLLRKKAQGVEIRLMYDDVGSLPHIGHLFCRKMRKLGIDCVRFGKLSPIASAVHNNRDHRKITVIDGKVGYTGGINLADEYINETHPFGQWKDTAVKLEGTAVAGLTYMFLQMFDLAQKKTGSYEQYFVPTALLAKESDGNQEDKGIVIPFADGPKPLYEEYVARNVYLNMIESATESLYITTPYLIADEAFNEAIARAAQRGVDVNIVIPGIPDKKAVYCLTKQCSYRLVKFGVKIYVYTKGFIHAKGIVADGEVGIVGTINLDYRSFMHHYEDGVFMYDTTALKQLKEDMLNVIEESSQMNENNKLKFWEKFVCLFANVFRPLL
ncbi:MAG: cardiolipin synthase [Clostridia bacterium]|nr:cardiolipin synthase [Clostridia bacterium]